LRAGYLPEVEALEKLLDIDLAAWKRPRAEHPAAQHPTARVALG
jgi:hypothetical protein